MSLRVFIPVFICLCLTVWFENVGGFAQEMTSGMSESSDLMLLQKAGSIDEITGTVSFAAGRISSGRSAYGTDPG